LRYFSKNIVGRYYCLLLLCFT